MTDDRKENAVEKNIPIENSANVSVAADRSSVIGHRLPETGGPKGPEPTRYGDWEHKGKCVDF